MEFEAEVDYDKVGLLDELVIADVQSALVNGKAIIKNVTNGSFFSAYINLTEKEIDVIKAGGRLNYVKIKGMQNSSLFCMLFLFYQLVYN